jgi:nitrogen fixation protein FixH
MVLSLMVAFFAVVIGVNAFMAHAAMSTFGGVETESSYRAGQMFERDVAQAKVQDDQHWQVQAKVTPAADGSAVLDIIARTRRALRSPASLQPRCSRGPSTGVSIARLP